MKKYFKYLMYVLEHKKNVFIECKKKDMLWHGITHDLSKFSPKEFFAYAEWFYGEHGKDNPSSPMHNEVKRKFKSAWKHHQRKNKHHWQYWRNQDMPHRYLMQMICDWTAMSKKFNDTPQAFYIRNYNKIELSEYSRVYLEMLLGLNDSLLHNYGHSLKGFKKIYDKKTYNDYFGDYILEKYGLDSYELID